MNADATPPIARDASWSDEERKTQVERARTLLRSHSTQAKATDIYKLAQRLKAFNEFGYARRLLGRIRADNNYEGLKKSPATVGQQHALCTYKDPDLPAADRFKKALEILAEADLLVRTSAETQESHGLRGAVHKRRWQVEGQRDDLERAVDSYLKGYQIGTEIDKGYTGINAAYVMELLAREQARQIVDPAARDVAVQQLRNDANEIRDRIAKLLPTLPRDRDDAGTTYAWGWWYYATLAEAHFGLDRLTEAVAALRRFPDVGQNEQPPDPVSPWEFESTVTQLASLAQLRADLEDLTGRGPGAVTLRKNARQALREYLGEYAPGADRAFDGKVGVALSGGGFRASLFHIGVLAYLAERDVLRHVEVLSCVSGGSIVGAYYYLELKELLDTRPEKGDGAISQTDYLALVQRVARGFLAGVQTNIRCQVFASVGANLRAFLQPGYTTTRYLATLYESRLYANIALGKGRSLPRHLKDLRVKPLDEDAGFKPRYDNWRRLAKVPNLILNATTLNTGHNWQFTASWMGEPPSSIDEEIDGNYRLRRVYHDDAPPGYREFSIGAAVAASSCVPAIFEPLVLEGLHDRKTDARGIEPLTVRLVDGGVYDNQGIASLLEQDCNVMIVSDASGQMDTVDHPGGGRLAAYSRSFSIAQARVRQAQYRELVARRKSGLLKSLTFLHLKKDLEADPVDWRDCQDPFSASDEARPKQRDRKLTSYQVRKDLQRLLSAVRTDLDSFTDVEAFSLMASGYAQASHAFDSQLPSFPAPVPPKEGWDFLRIEPSLRQRGAEATDLELQLKVASASAGKVWRLVPALKVVGAGLALAGLAGLVYLWWANRGVQLLTVGSLGIFVAVVAGMAVAPHIVRLIRYRQTFTEIGLRGALAVLLAIGFRIHLWLFDRWFLRRGRLDRLLKLRA